MKFKAVTVLCGIFAGLAISVSAHAADTHTYSISSGSYDSVQFVWIDSDDNIELHYTTDGSVPTESNEIYDSRRPVVITENTKLRCAAYIDGDLVENSSLTVKIRTDCASASKESGTYKDAIKVKLTCPDKEADIYYTTDGSKPTVNSKLYKGALTIKKDTVLKFVTIKDGYTYSKVVTEEYLIGRVYEEAERQTLFELVNKVRKEHGLEPLEEMKELSEIAQQRAEECSYYFSHWRPNGTKWDSLLAKLDLKRNDRAENIAYYYATPKRVLNSWMNSSGHRKNILDPDLKYIGIGYYNNGFCPYWTQIFLGDE